MNRTNKAIEGLFKFGFRFKALGGANELQLYAPSEKLAVSAAEAALIRIQEIEKKYSRYREDSVVTAINQSAGKEKVEIDPETVYLLQFADRCWKTSGGLFDCTSGVLRKAWNFSQRRIPRREELEPLLALVGWEHVELSVHSVYLPIPGMEIDFGGIGKEYASDCAAQVCRSRGISHGLINLGGDIVALGPHPDGTPWQLGISHPRDKHKVLSSVPLTQGALATSGDYERYFELEGKRYCHILNPKSGMPVDTMQSASILAPRCLEAGGLATISMLLGCVEAEKILEQQGLTYLFVDGEGRVHQGAQPA